VTLSAVDTSLLANNPDTASSYLQSAATALRSSTAQQAIAKLLALRLQTLQAPNKTAALAWISALENSDLSGLARRNAVRSLLATAQQLWAREQVDVAKRLAQAAVKLAVALPESAGGWDQDQLRVWRGRVSG
jgi:hypothetical protein